MFNGPEIWIIILLVVVLFGGSRLPKIARNLGKAQSELKKVSPKVLLSQRRTKLQKPTPTSFGVTADCLSTI